MNLYTNTMAWLPFYAMVPTLSTTGSSSGPMTITSGKAAQLELLAHLPSVSASVPTSFAVELPRAQYAASLPAAVLRTKMERKTV